MGRQIIFSRAFFIIFLVCCVFLLAYTSFSQPVKNTQSLDDHDFGKNIFKKNCSGCHLGGKNVIKPDKPLIGSTKLKLKNSFKDFIQDPPPPMPKFKNIASEPKQLDALYKYVSSLKEK